MMLKKTKVERPNQTNVIEVTEKRQVDLILASLST